MPVRNDHIGTRIRAARHAKGWTQSQLATAIGTRERNIIRWENDQHEPRAQHVAAIAEATGKDVAFFFEKDEPGAEDDSEAADPMAQLPALFATLIDRLVDAKLAARAGATT